MLPRSAEDEQCAFFVVSGSVKVAYGQLGAYVLRTAKEDSQAAAHANVLGSRGSRRARTRTPRTAGVQDTDVGLHSPLVPFDEKPPDADQLAAVCPLPSASLALKTVWQLQSQQQQKNMQDRSEARHRALARAFLDPEVLRKAWDATVSYLKAKLVLGSALSARRVAGTTLGANGAVLFRTVVAAPSALTMM